MFDSDFTEFCKIMDIQADIRKVQRLTNEQLAAYFDALKSLTLDTLKELLRSHLYSANGKFMPTVPDIIQEAFGTPEQRANEAWLCVLRGMEHGAYYDIRFENPAIHYAINQMGGWVHFAKSYNLAYTDSIRKEMGFQFRSIFKRAEQRRITWSEAPAVLKGELKIQSEVYTQPLPPELTFKADTPIMLGGWQ